MRSSSGSVETSPRRRWVTIHLAVALTLLLGLAALALRNEAVAVEAHRTLCDNTIPSMVRLERMQAVLRRMQEDLLLADLDAAPPRERLERRLAARWTGLQALHAELEHLPALAGEREFHGRLRPLLAELRDVQEALVHAPDGDAARRVQVWQLRPVVRDIADSVAELMRRNERGARDAARALADVQRLGRRTSLALAVGVVVSLGFMLRAGRRANAAVARSLEELDAFSARVAHDLKSPLQATSLALGSLRQEALSPGGERALALIDRSVARQSSMVDGLLALAQAGARPAPGDRASVRAVADELWPGLGQLAEQESARLSLDLAEDLTVAASPVALASMLENLLRNALLYLGASPRREVTLRARSCLVGVTLEVEDTGPGIPPDALRRLFQPFQRASERPGGAGLGLATVKRMAEAHGGQVEVRSRVGEGSVFTLRLPRAPAPAQPSAPPRRRLARSSQKRG